MILNVHQCTSFVWFSFAMVFGAIAGCEPAIKTGTVKGTVTFNGKPYDGSAIMLLDMTTGQAAGVDIGPDGQFSIDQPMQLGTYNVYLAPKSVDVNAEPQAVKVDASVPSKYWSESTTDLTVTVVEGENAATIALLK